MSICELAVNRPVDSEFRGHIVLARLLYYIDQEVGDRVAAVVRPQKPKEGVRDLYVQQGQVGEILGCPRHCENRRRLAGYGREEIGGPTSNSVSDRVLGLILCLGDLGSLLDIQGEIVGCAGEEVARDAEDWQFELQHDSRLPVLECGSEFQVDCVGYSVNRGDIEIDEVLVL